MKEILVTLPFTAAQRRALETAAGEDCRFHYVDKASVTAADIAAAAVLVGNVPPALIGASESLELLQLGSSGADAYVKEGVLSPNTVLACSTGAYSQAVAEHALAQTLMLQKNLHRYRDNQSRRQWRDEGPVTSPNGALAAVIGLGEIGLYYAKLMCALGARVIGVKRRVGVCPEGLEALYGFEALDKVLARADIVMSVLPETPQTHHLFTKERFAAMKNTALFINVGRGGAVASEALQWALETGRIAAAAIDVAEEEPLSADSPLWALPNLLITPHVAGDFHLSVTLERVADIAAKNLRAWREGGAYINLVDFETGYRK